MFLLSFQLLSFEKSTFVQKQKLSTTFFCIIFTEIVNSTVGFIKQVSKIYVYNLP